jgi:hypothetical protein
MAKIIRTTTRVELSGAEQASVLQGVRELARHNSAHRTAMHRRNAAMKRRLRAPMLSALRRADVNIAQICDAGLERYELECDKGLKQLRRSNAPALAKRTRKQPRDRHAIFGQAWGEDLPPYDFNWEDPVIVGRARPQDALTVANPITGDLECQAAAGHDAPADSVDSYAGLMFWYIPNQTGTLNVGITPTVEADVFGGAYHDAGDAGTWITLGVNRFARDPFVPVDWVAKQVTPLESFSAGWKEIDSGQNTWDPNSMQVSFAVDPQFQYACWAWIEAYAYHSGDGFAWAHVKTKIEAFAFWMDA